MTGIDGKVVAITGASSGISRAAALLLAGRGAKVVLGARRTDELEALVREIEGAGGARSLTARTWRNVRMLPRSPRWHAIDMASSTCSSAMPVSVRFPSWRTCASRIGRQWSTSTLRDCCTVSQPHCPYSVGKALAISSILFQPLASR